MATTNNPVVSALAAYPGKYSKELITRFYNGMDFANDITVMPDVKSKLNLTKLSVNDTARPYTGTFAAKNGDLVYTPRVLEVFRSQRDMEVDPEKYRTTWMGEYQGPGSSSDQKNIPFAQAVWELVMGEQSAGINDRVAFGGLGTAAFTAFATGDTASSGAYVSWSDGTRVNYYKTLASVSSGETPVTHPAKFSDRNLEAIAKGLGTIITAEIAGSALTPYATGAIDSSNAYTALSALYRSLSVPNTRGGVTMYMSFTDFYAFVDHYQTSVQKYTQAEGQPMFLPNTNNNCLIKPCTWITGRRVFVGKKANFLYGTDKLSDMNTITTIPKHYSVEASMSALHGFQIADLGAMVCNDQA